MIHACWRTGPTGLALLLTLACAGDAGDDASEDPEPARWTLSAEPALRIGVVEGDDAYQLHDVRHATVLADGRIAVANQGTREIRVYDEGGRFVFASGEDGDGPGEWRLLDHVRDLGADTLLAVDHRLGRYGFLDARTGQYLGEASATRAADLAHSRWHHGGLVLEAPAGSDTSPDAFAAVVDRLDVRDDGAPAFVQLDRAGRFWVSGAPSASIGPLRLFDAAGREHARLALPPRFRPTEIGDGYVLGVWRDSLDVEYVQMHMIVRPEGDAGAFPAVGRAAAADATGLTGVEDASASDLGGLSEAFRSVAIAQEIHYSVSATYTTEMDALLEARQFDLPEGIRLDFMAASPTGWWGRVVDRETGAGCSLLYGSFPPVEGLSPGAFTCWTSADGTAAPGS